MFYKKKTENDGAFRSDGFDPKIDGFIFGIRYDISRKMLSLLIMALNGQLFLDGIASDESY